MGEPSGLGPAPELPAGATDASLPAVAAVPGTSSLDDLLHRLQAGQADPQTAAGPQYLLFQVGGLRCAGPLTALREVLRDVPRTIPLPNSPEWMFGIFPSRSEMLALVDPVPVLVGGSAPGPTSRADRLGVAEGAGPSVLVVSADEQSVALLVDSYGETATIMDHELLATSEAGIAAEQTVAQRYIAGFYRPDDSEQSFVALDTGNLLADLTSALREGDESVG